MVDMKYTSYAQLKGADLSDDPSRISRSRSPDILNMISDNGGNPIKRKGWEYLLHDGLSIVNGRKTIAELNAYLEYEEGEAYRINDSGTAKGITFEPGDIAVCVHDSGESPSDSDWQKGGERTLEEFTGIYRLKSRLLFEGTDSEGDSVIFRLDETHTAGGLTVLDFILYPTVHSGNTHNRILYNDYLYTYDCLSYLRLSANGTESYEAYIPKYLIAADPETGAGTQYESLNILTGARSVSYMWGGQHGMVGTGTNGAIEIKTCAQLDAILTYTEGNAYRLSYSGTAKGISFSAGDLAVCAFTNTDSSQAEDSHWIKISPVIKVIAPSGMHTSSCVVKRLCDDGSWFEETGGTWSQRKESGGISYYEYTLPAATKTGKAESGSYPTVTVSDNIEIVFTTGLIPTYYYADYSKVGTEWNGRVFMDRRDNAGRCVGVWYSEQGNPAYIPDANYIDTNGDITGFAPVGTALAVLKKEEDQTVDFLTEGTVTDTITDAYGNTSTRERTVYKVTHGTKGFLNLCHDVPGIAGEPLFLSRTGITGIVTGSQDNSRYIKNRSCFIDRKLKQSLSGISDTLTSCAMAAFDDYLIASVGSDCYVLDARQKATDVRQRTTYVYEAYVWDNILATSFCTIGDTLYFIRSDDNGTHLCRFKHSGSSADYSDGTSATDSTVTGTAINAHFATMFDNDGTTALYKTLQKKGTGCTVVPYDRSSVTAYLNKDNTEDVFIGTTDVSEINYENLQFYRFSADIEVGGIQIGPFYADRLDFNDIDFTRFAFVNSELTRDFYFRKKLKKYKRVQIKLANNVINEPFGILEIFKTYTIGNYAKR